MIEQHFTLWDVKRGTGIGNLLFTVLLGNVTFGGRVWMSNWEVLGDCSVTFYSFRGGWQRLDIL